MPAINALKQYRPNTIYHVYNRGVNKQDVFFSERDYMVFRNLARTTQYEMAKTGSQIEVFAFALLPNHFHFILWQYYERDMVHFMRSLTLKYVKYVNEEYERVGNLFMRPYKARLLYTPVQVAKATRYVLQNPVDANLPADWKHVGTKL